MTKPQHKSTASGAQRSDSGRPKQGPQPRSCSPGFEDFEPKVHSGHPANSTLFQDCDSPQKRRPPISILDPPVSYALRDYVLPPHKTHSPVDRTSFDDIQLGVPKSNITNGTLMRAVANEKFAAGLNERVAKEARLLPLLFIDLFGEEERVLFGPQQMPWLANTDIKGGWISWVGEPNPVPAMDSDSEDDYDYEDDTVSEGYHQDDGDDDVPSREGDDDDDSGDMPSGEGGDWNEDDNDNGSSDEEGYQEDDGDDDMPLEEEGDDDGNDVPSEEDSDLETSEEFSSPTQLRDLKRWLNKMNRRSEDQEASDSDSFPPSSPDSSSSASDDPLYPFQLPSTSLHLPNEEHRSRNLGNTNTKPAIQRMKRILHNTELYKALLRCNNTDAQIILDILYKLLDAPTLGNNIPFLKAIMRLSQNSGLYPRCLTLHDVQTDRQALTAGGFGEIWLGQFRDEKVCLKVMKSYQRSNFEDRLKKFICEAILWSQLIHPNLCPFYGIYHLTDNSNRLCLISPWMEDGNINEYLRNHPMVPRLNFIRDIAQGLNHLHDYGFVHGDLKGLNVLINRWGMACLTDFGFSSVIDIDVLWWSSLQTSTEPGFTPHWVAPEVLDPDEDQQFVQPSTESDIWSFAAVTYEILSGLLPYYEYHHPMTVIYKKANGILPSRPAQGTAPELTDDIWNLMQDCWKRKPQERPQISEIISRLPRVDQARTRPSQSYFKNQIKARISTFRNAMYGENSYVTTDELALLTRLSNGA